MGQVPGVQRHRRAHLGECHNVAGTNKASQMALTVLDLYGFGWIKVDCREQTTFRFFIILYHFGIWDLEYKMASVDFR